MIPQNREKNMPGQPWYRYPMVWMIILLPMIAVVASIATLIVASKNAPLLLNNQQVSESQKDPE
jgi:hypothetical protein